MMNKKRGVALGCSINEALWQKRILRSIIRTKQTINFEVWEERMDTADKRIFYHCSSIDTGNKIINSRHAPEGWILSSDASNEILNQDMLDNTDEVNGLENLVEEFNTSRNINSIAEQLTNDNDFVNALVMKLGTVFEKKHVDEAVQLQAGEKIEDILN